MLLLYRLSLLFSRLSCCPIADIGQEWIKALVMDGAAFPTWCCLDVVGPQLSFSTQYLLFGKFQKL